MGAGGMVGLGRMLGIVYCYYYAGSWKLEAGNWNLETGTWNLEPGTLSGKKERSLVMLIYRMKV